MRRTALLIALLLLGALAADRLPRTVAHQESSPTAGHIIVGSWQVTYANPVDPEVPALFTLAADGTMAVAFQPKLVGGAGVVYASAGHGVWAGTGERTAEARVISLAANEAGELIRIQENRYHLELGADGQSFTGTYDVVGRDAAGNVAASREGLPVSGTRITLEPAATPAP